MNGHIVDSLLKIEILMFSLWAIVVFALRIIGVL